MGAGGILRWREHAELRSRFNAVVDGIVAAVETDGFAAGFSPDEVMYVCVCVRVCVCVCVCYVRACLLVCVRDFFKLRVREHKIKR